MKLILKTADRASVVGSPFSTVIGKISTFHNILLSTTFYALLMKIIICIGMFQKVAPLQISSNRQVIKFLRDVLNILENLLEEY